MGVALFPGLQVPTLSAINEKKNYSCQDNGEGEKVMVKWAEQIKLVTIRMQIGAPKRDKEVKTKWK